MNRLLRETNDRGYKIVLRVQDHISWPALLDLVLRRTLHKCCVASVGRIASAAGAGMPISPRQKALPIRGRASADHVDGLRRTQPVYLNKLTRAGPAGWGQPRVISGSANHVNGLHRTRPVYLNKRTCAASRVRAAVGQNRPSVCYKERNICLPRPLEPH